MKNLGIIKILSLVGGVAFISGCAVQAQPLGSVIYSNPDIVTNSVISNGVTYSTGVYPSTSNAIVYSPAPVYYGYTSPLIYPNASVNLYYNRGYNYGYRPQYRPAYRPVYRGNWNGYHRRR